MIWNCFMVGLGGFVGSILRYLVGLLPLDTGNGFPIKTFLINLIGAFLLGFLSVCLGKRVDLPPQVALFLKVGLCGDLRRFPPLLMSHPLWYRMGIWAWRLFI